MADTAGDVLMRSLHEQIEAFHSRATEVAFRDAEGVHKMRVASRQLRSQLGTFHGLLDRTVTDPLREELKWFAGLLGIARDAEVIRIRLAAAVEREPADLILGDIGARIDAELVARRKTAHDRLDEVMAGERYATLAANLDRLEASPPLDGEADSPAVDGLRKPLRRRYRQLRGAVRAVADAADEGTADLLRHEVRKAAKRLRYAAESVVVVFGEEAAQTAALAEDIQGGLGEQQDSIHARRYLLQASSVAVAGDANTFSYGLLYCREFTAAAAGVKAADRGWKSLRRKQHRAWFG